MRHLLFAALSAFVVSPGLATPTGLPTNRFVQSWTPLPSDHFTLVSPRGPFGTLRSHATEVPDAALALLLDDAFASARGTAERRDIALDEMMAPWDQAKRTAFQHLRDAEAAYAGSDDARQDRFAATLARVVDGTGRSAAVDGPSSADLDKAYAAALGRAQGDARVAAEAEQARWRTYSDAFSTFADLQTPGSAGGVTAELGRQRVNDLAAGNR